MKEDRVFTTKNKDGEDWVLVFRRPTQNIVNKAELVSRAKYSNALRQGVLLAAEAQKLLKQRELYSAEDEQKEFEIRKEIKKLEEKLESPELSNDDGGVICTKITVLRRELRDHTRVVTSMLENTCESIANEERNQFFAAECIYDNTTGARVYKNIDDFKERFDEEATLDSYKEALIASLEVSAGKDLPSDLTSEWPENKWLSLRKPQQETEEEKPKKSKRGRKKKTAQ